MPKRRDVLVHESEIGGWLLDGMTIGVGGLVTSSVPMVLVREIVRRELRELTIVSPMSSIELDLLIGAGCVRTVRTAYAGAESLAPVCPIFRHAAEHGEIEVREVDEAHVLLGLRAAAQGLPSLPWRGGLGTSLPELNPDLVPYEDPISGEPLLAVAATPVDVAIIHAGRADRHGNVQHVGTGLADRALERAADATLVQVERVVPNEEIRRDPASTSMHRVDAVVRAPFGAHPFASPGHHLRDERHLEEYLDAARRLAREGDRGPFEDYLARYVLGPEGHPEYLDRIGMQRLASLHEY